MGDPHNTTIIAIDAKTQTVTRRYETPFGTPRGTVPSNWPDDNGFLDKPYDTETGVVYTGIRQYDPVTGRFLSPDQLVSAFAPQQLSEYEYADNSPETLTDPSGLRPIADGPNASAACPSGDPSDCDYNPSPNPYGGRDAPTQVPESRPPTKDELKAGDALYAKALETVGKYQLANPGWFLKTVTRNGKKVTVVETVIIIALLFKDGRWMIGIFLNAGGNIPKPLLDALRDNVGENNLHVFGSEGNWGQHAEQRAGTWKKNTAPGQSTYIVDFILNVQICQNPNTGCATQATTFYNKSNTQFISGDYGIVNGQKLTCEGGNVYASALDTLGYNGDDVNPQKVAEQQRQQKIQDEEDEEIEVALEILDLL